jgi:hypothetical protein
MRLLKLLLFLGPAAFAQARADLLSDYVAAHVVVLDRPVLSFHYTHDRAEPASPEEAFRYLNKSVPIYNDATVVTDDLAGPGLYLAVDPVGSRSFGNERPMLYTIQLKTGTRLVDFRGRGERDAEALQNIAKASGCAEAMTFESLRNDAQLQCRQVLIEAFRKNHIDAVMYSYSASGSLQNCREDRKVAFVAVSATALDAASVSYYSSKRILGSAPAKTSFMSQLFDEAAQDVDIRYYGFSSKPKSLVGASPTEARKYEETKANLLWGCGHPQPGEDL